MIILGIETSTFAGSIALLKDGMLVNEYTFSIGPKHNEKLIPSIKWLISEGNLNKEDIDVIAVSSGPGSFTSLRVGVATAKTLSFSLGAKLVSVSSLEILASNVVCSVLDICPMINARKNEVYFAYFENHLNIKRKSKDSFGNPDTVFDNLENETVFLGDGALEYSPVLKKKFGSKAVILPSHLNIARASNCAFLSQKKIKAGKFEDAAKLVPNYLRKSEAELKRGL